MSGECEICGEHTLDCVCKYDKCKKCGNIIYSNDKTCTKCLIRECLKTIIENDELIKKLERE